VTPLTNDNATIASQLEALTPDIMPSAGSNTALAVEKAVELFKQAGLQNGQVLLITDGVNSDEIGAVLKKLGDYQLSVLAVGTEQGAPISLPDGGFLKDESGAIVVPKLPASALQQLASDGHGIYQAISDNDNDIKALLASVDKSVQKAGDNNGQNNMLLQKWDEKGVWLLLLVLPLAALNFRRGLLAVAFLFILPLPKNSYALEWQDLWQTKNQQAQQAFNHQQYDKAAQLFEDPAWQAAALYKSEQAELKQLKTPKTATGFYNQGNVFAKAGEKESKIEAKIENFKNAIKAYDEALKLEPNNADAKYNKELVEKELKKLQQQQEQQKQADKNKQDQKDQQKPDNKDQKDNKDKQGDKDNKNSQDKKDNKDDKSQKDQQKPEQAENKKDSKPEDKQQQEKQDQQQSEQEKQAAQQAEQAKKQQPEKPEQKDQAQQAAQLQEDEKNQANEQWLKRIPDDPAGLLRRKFKYQYGQRQRQESSAQSW
jgi:Ca-activated chloride channel family protein